MKPRIFTLKDCMALTGFLLIVGGAGWVYPPAAPIIAGVMVLSLSIIAHLRGPL